MSERTVRLRSSCYVPGCWRWSTRFEGDWLCAEHWRLVPRELKYLRTALRRRWRRRLAKAEAQHGAAGAKGTWLALRRAGCAWNRGEDAVWRRMKRAAVERAAGL